MENLQPESVSRETLITQYFPGQSDAIQRYADFLVGAGIERGLIGPREGERIWDRHIFNCLPITQLLPEGASLTKVLWLKRCTQVSSPGPRLMFS